MIQTKNRVFDDIARVAGGAVSIASGLTKQVKEEIRSRVDEMATKLDLVPREDFLRLENRVAALEKAAAKTTSDTGSNTGLKKATVKKIKAKSAGNKPAAKKAMIAKKPLQKKTPKK